MSVMALLSDQGTACHETALYENEFTLEARAKIEERFCTGRPDAPLAGTWTDCTEAFSE